jgi:excinuclease UvrABC helicase subunit UvrB
MMNTRAQASIEYKAEQYELALRTVRRGLRQIKQFFRKFDQEEVFSDSSEVRSLKRMARDIKKKLPKNPIKQLQMKLQNAVKKEAYEEAAVLRDQIEAMKREMTSS